MSMGVTLPLGPICVVLLLLPKDATNPLSET